MNLAEVTRSGLIESVHTGSIAVTGTKGGVLAFFGEVEQPVFMRSAEKPLQALPIVEFGVADRFNFSESEIAVICGSHSGQKFHIEAVSSILEKIGLDEGALKCAARYPLHRKSSNELILEGKKPGPVHNPCSGKHAGMLALSVFFGYSIEDYYEVNHPVQKIMLESISYMAEVKKDDIKIGIDGCGVPVHGIPLKNIALCFAKLTNPKNLPTERGLASQRIVKAMRNNPKMVAGDGRLCTALIQSTENVIAKVGAEGVYCAGIPDRDLGIAIKIEDGGGRALSPVVIEVLDQLDLLDENELKLLADYHYPPVMTHQKEVIGVVRPVFDLNLIP